MQIADKFDVTESAAHTCLMRVLRFLQHISASVIVWPDTQRQEVIKAGFRTKVKGRSIPDVVGCIDGSHIDIKEPRESQDSYYNRKKFHSVVLQGICDHELKFLDVFIGHPGASHDARILADSFFYAATKCAGGYLLGDAAYPLAPWLMAPYKDLGRDFSAWKSKYNLVHSQQRIVIVHAFGVLKQRFQRLYYIDSDSITQACLLILGACVLHNLCTSEDDFEDVCNVALDSDE